ncbi:MAG: hypothetical protein IT364_22640 [Candidatus Hydrogenedentes bacterium]|nr:hypothetical protein [Candidatus Hydrogenedentota bacterium]
MNSIPPSRARGVWRLAVAAVLLGSWTASGQPSASLGISPGGHYITQDGKPLVLIGDSGTQCVLQNANLDYRRWVDDCIKAGLSTVHVWSFVAPRQKADGSVLEERYGYVYPALTPWARKASGERAADGEFQYDLRNWDEGDDPKTHYWPRLRDLCVYTKEKGLVLGITVFFGWPKHAPDWEFHPFNVRNGGPLTDAPKPHVSQVQRIAAPGREVWQETWSDNWDPAMKNQWLWEQFAKKLIDETAPFGNVFFVFMDEHSYEEGNGGDHFLQFFKSRGAMWADWDKRRADVDMVFADIGYRKDSGKNAGTVKLVQREPARPFIILEGGPYTGDEVRTAIWTCLVGGGHYVLHNDAEQETVHTGIMGYDPKVPGGDTGQTRREWLGHASRFFNSEVVDLDGMMPHNELTREGAFCLAAPGREYVVYAIPGSEGPMGLTLHGAGKVQSVRLYTPRTGESMVDVLFTAEGTEVSVSKPDAQDWVLHVQQAAE